MKPRSIQLLPRTLVVCIAPLLVCASASADVLTYNEANATGVWNVPSGTNLLSLAGNVVTSTSTFTAPAPPENTPAVHEASSGSWATLSDGILGTPGGTSPPYKGQTVTPANGDTLTYQLDLTGHPDGYDITSFDSYCMWGDPNRDDQRYTLQYSTDGVTYNDIAIVINNDANPNKATHSSLTDTSGVLATGVKFVKVIFGNPNASFAQENGFVGFSEFVLRSTPTNVLTFRESKPVSDTSNWTLPAGTNLLNGSTATAAPAITGKEAVTQTTLSTLTNGLLGDPANHPSSVAPDNNTTMIFPLNTSVNFNGYNISSIDTYCAWANSGRDNQMLEISYATIDNPVTVGVDESLIFIPLGTAVLNTGEPNNSTHVRLTPEAGFLATGVSKIKINTGHQENGYVGYREFIALGTAVSISDPLTWTGGSGSGGNANWVTTADSNWKKTIGGAASNFSSLAALTFDSVPANRNISVPAALTASSMAFTNDVAHPFTFGGSLVTVSNDIVSSGAGSATFNNPMKATSGVTLSGAGSLVFNGALESTGITLAGTGGITLNGANPALTGSASVSDGTLTVSNNDGLQNASLSMTGGTALFTSAAPHVASISSASEVGSIILGKTIGPVNTTLSVGDAASGSIFGGAISQASGTVGGFTKTGASSLSLSGTNTYTGVTTVTGGTLQIDQVLSLYQGVPASWTAGNLVVGAGGTLTFKVGGSGEFEETDINANLSLGGFAPGSFLGINCAFDMTLSRNLTQPGLGLVKSGSGILSLTGTNTSSGDVKIFAGGVIAAGTGSPAINGNVIMGNTSTDVSLSMGAGTQLDPSKLITFTNGNFYGSKINLRGTTQTVAGLDSALFPANKVSLVQNDEPGQPGYTTPPGDATLIINATTDHSFYGLIRNESGGPLSVIKNGPGTQEFRNMPPIQGYGYTGPTTINEGTLRINFATGNNGFGSNISVADIATLNFHSVGGGYDFDRAISGPGKVVVTGTNPIALTNGSNSWTGGTTVNGGFLALKATNANGQGDGAGQTCTAGAMDPSNVINLINGGTLSLDNAGALGNSPVLPEFAPSIKVNEGCKIFGGTNTIAFLCNVTLDGGKIEITNGAAVAGFTTNLCLVGTQAKPLIVGGVSTVPAEIHTTGTGPNANVSLGSKGSVGTVFQVADVTSSSASDLTVSSILTNVHTDISKLTKKGPGTMQLMATNTYTGKTHVMEGELRVDVACLADVADVEVDAAGTLNLAFTGVDTVSRLTLAGAGMAGGVIYGSTTNSTPGITQTPRITGPGMLFVTNNPVVSDPYTVWAAQIPNAADRDKTDDPDGDGFTNIQEFLFGTSPTANTGALSTFEKSGSNLIVRWNQRATGSSTYLLQEGTTLVEPWATSPAPINNNPVQDLPDYVRKEAVVPIDNARKFARVKATE